MAKKKKNNSKLTQDLDIIDKIMSPNHLLWLLLFISLLANLSVGIALWNN